MEYINPYLYGMRCVSGKWKTTLLHHIHTYGAIRFNETKKTLPISEKVLSQQLKELERDGLIKRIQYQVMPLKVEYVLTPIGEELIPALEDIMLANGVCLEDVQTSEAAKTSNAAKNSKHITAEAEQK